jgi:simple sugar transport system permease protein/D-xylose transport system permease protein
VLVWSIFGAMNPIFLSSTNLSNLAVESVSVGTIAIGVVFVLLVAQIDLSVGSMSGVASSLLGVGLTKWGLPLPVTILIALLFGVGVGVVYSFVFVRFNVPTFVSTLAGLLALLGFQLWLIGPTGTINISFESWIVRFMEQMYLSRPLSYALVAVASTGYAATALARIRRRRKAGLPTGSLASVLLTSGLLLVVLEAAAWYLNKSSGISTAFAFFILLIVVANFALRRTRWGRYVYAVGASPEAARRAGINVTLIYTSALALGTTLAALGGLLAAGRLAAATVSSGTGDVNLNAIAAAVIGGTSLFGGRGNAYSALLGILVIQSISNGLTLLALSSPARFMVTGAVLLIAVIVDSVSYRSRVAHGRA